MTQTVTDTVETSNIPSVVESSLLELKSIATLPVVALRIMRLVDDPKSSVQEVNDVIASDPALTARVLKIVNSSFYGLSREIGSIDRAVVLLGLNAVKNIAIAASLDKVFRPDQIGTDFDARDLWTHSIAVATGARELAIKARHAMPDEAFLAGLMHDIGIMIEMQTCRSKFVEALTMLADDQSLTFREAEQQSIGATHELFGIGLCRDWNFPLHIEFVAGFHHRPMELPETVRILPAIVHVADILAARIDVGYTRTVEIEQVDPELLCLLNLSDTDIDAVAETLSDSIAETQRLFSGDETT